MNCVINVERALVLLVLRPHGKLDSGRSLGDFPAEQCQPLARKLKRWKNSIVVICVAPMDSRNVFWTMTS